MDRDETQKLIDNLNKELIGIDKELSYIATENPEIKGDFNVKVEDIGSSPDDTAEEAGELDRNQAIVETLVTRRKEVVHSLEKIKAGTYGK